MLNLGSPASWHFYNALSVELQKIIRLDGYILPDNLTLSTFFTQTPAL